MTLDELVARASAEGWAIRPPTLEPQPIRDHDDAIVGFFCPHAAGRGRARVGPIYVAPEHRGRRLGEQAYADRSKPLVAYVHSENTASERLHERVGFRRWYRTRGGWYWVRP